MGTDHGALIIAATPLGNPADAGGRLIRWLAEADVVAAEDTRKTLRLAADLGITISGRLVSHYDAVENARAHWLADEVAAGRTVLVVSDAGMPLVSDPGTAVVRECLDRRLPITCLPGPSAVTTALVLSGLPADRFCFEGFLPRRGPQRRRRLRDLGAEARTMVFFESPRRTAQALADMVQTFGADRPAAVCREISKTYEEVLCGSVAELAEQTADIRGEVTIVVGGALPVVSPPEDHVAQVEDLVAGGKRRSEAISQVARDQGLSRRALYEAVMAARAAARS